MRIVSPGLSFNVSSMALSAVRPVSAKAAALTCDRPAGFFATIAAFSAIFSAYAPSCPASQTPKAASPTLRSVTPSPTEPITPEKSRPRINGNFACAYWPARTFQSAAFTLAACTSITTSPGWATGSGKSPYFRTSGPPNCSMKAAFIGFVPVLMKPAIDALLLAPTYAIRSSSSQGVAASGSRPVTGDPGDLLGRFLRHSNVPASILPLYCSRRTGYAGCAAGGGWRRLPDGGRGMNLRSIIGTAALALASVWPASAADLLVTQYKNDPSGAPYGIALEKG